MSDHLGAVEREATDVWEVRPMRTELGPQDGLSTFSLRGVPLSVREYRQGDDIDRFTAGSDVERGDSHRDSIFVAESGGRIVGVLVERLIPVIHTFELEPSPIARRVADALIHYGKGFTKASGFKEVTFYVEPGNTAMQAYIEGHGAVKEENADVYTMEVK